jgi:lipooligosaccharide transport system permease protein
MTHPALRQVEHELLVYRRIWRGQLATAFLSPLLFLLAIGLGLGHSIDRSGGGNAASLGGVRYLAFLVPGLLASTAMQMGASESLWPVQGGFTWQRFFHAAAATPLRPFDILLGWVLWIGARLAVASAVFLAVAAGFGALRSPLALLAVPASVLTGLAFAAPLTAFTATRESDTSFPLIMRFGVLPLFLFSGAFFPISRLPAGLRIVAWATPLWHGVELCRALTLGRVAAGATLVHVAVLVGFVTAGLAVGARTFTRRLTP